VPDLSALLRPSAPGERVTLVALSHFGDLTSHELAQRLARRVLPALDASAPRLPPSLAAVARGAALPSTSADARPPAPSSADPPTRPATPPRRFVVVGLGTPSAARLFLRETGLEAAAEAPGAPAVVFLATAAGAPLYRRALGFEPGFAPDASNLSPYAKLLVMLAGLGSDRGATIREVLRGYVGDRGSDAIFFDRGWTPFDVLGGGYQRPFELATQRLLNMGAVLGRWSELAPAAAGVEGELLTQQGGVLVFRPAAAAGGEGGEVEVAFSHRDAGILCYADTDALTGAMM